MKINIDFINTRKVKDELNPFCDLFVYEDGSSFYIEPSFYTQLEGFKEQHPNEFIRIIKRMEEVTKKNHKVVFTGNYDYPQTLANDYIYLEITDITDPLNIYVEDKSRGSDYGD